MNRQQSKENRGKFRRYSLANNLPLRLSRKYWISSFIIYLITHFYLNYPQPVPVWPRSSVGAAFKFTLRLQNFSLLRLVPHFLVMHGYL